MAKEFIASPQQNDYFTFLKSPLGSAVLQAVAGSGKTTTLIQGLQYMTGEIFIGAYNKKIADEIQDKVKKLGLQRNSLTITTMHAAGFGIWRRFARHVKVDGKKCKNIFRDAASRHPEYAPYEDAVCSLVSYAKQAGVGILSSTADRQIWLKLIDHFDIETCENDVLVIQLAKKLLEKSIEQDHQVIDFEDMIYAPLVHKVKAPEYDWVMIDEAQDTNATRRALALAMLKRGGRLIAVGDPHQAIYGFTGADADSLKLISDAVSAKQIPLTVTYRCPKAVVRYAQQFVSHIQAHPSAPEGIVRKIGEQDKDETLVTAAKPGDAVLCRFNAPIIKAAYSFIAAGVRAKVEGRDIGNGLKVLARRWKKKMSFSAFFEKLDEYSARESAKFRAKEQESRAVGVEDKVECLKILANKVMLTTKESTISIDALCEQIDMIFGDNVGEDHVLLSTIHKSKGREWSKVIWIQTGPSKWARKAWELEQETNLCYVAATRAMNELVLCDV